MKKQPIWVVPFTIDDINKRCRNTLIDHLGIEFTEIGDEHLTAIMPVDRRTFQPMGLVHGGATATLAETVGSGAANYCVDVAHFCVGLDLNINHIRTAQSGYLTGIAIPLHIGKSTHVWEIKIYNEAKQLISAARLTIIVKD